MISVLPTHPKAHLRLLLLLSCGLVLTAGFSHAAITAEALYADLEIVQEAIRNDDPALAEKLLRNILKTEQNNPLAHRLLGNVLLQTGLVDAAIAEFTTALQIDPQDELARDYLFSIYYNHAQDLLEIPLEAYKARGELEKAIAIRPGGIMSYYFLGFLDYQEKRDAECIATLMKVADTIPEKLRSNLHTMLYNSAFNLLNQKRAQDAKDVLPYFFTLPQATINELLLTATIALEIGDFAKATELYDRVLNQDPLHAVALHNRGIAQQRLDEIRQKEAAAALLQQQSLESPPTENLSKPPATPVTSAP
jgi:tetratricopeptide (TPR) repeat protein